MTKTTKTIKVLDFDQFCKVMQNYNIAVRPVSSQDVQRLVDYAPVVLYGAAELCKFDSARTYIRDKMNLTKRSRKPPMFKSVDGCLVNNNNQQWYHVIIKGKKVNKKGR